MNIKNNKVLITGGAGFIGSHLADFLAKKGYQVRILDNLSPVVHKNRSWPQYLLNKNYELIRGDVRRKKDWEKALKNITYVFHFAAYQDQKPDFHKFFDVNTTGTAFLYEIVVSKKLPLKKVIIASTQFVYGDGYYEDADGKTFLAEQRSLTQLKNKKWGIPAPSGKPARLIPFSEEQEPQPPNAYSLSKLAMEKLALRFGKIHNIPTTILRFSIVQGSRQSPHNLYSGALRIFITQALSKKPITVFEDGKQLRDFINIKDAILACHLVMKKHKTNFEIFNVGGGKNYKVLDFAKLVKKITNSSSLIKIGGFRPTDSRHAVSDIHKLKKLGWQPFHQPKNSILEYLSWYQKFISFK